MRSYIFISRLIGRKRVFLGEKEFWEGIILRSYNSNWGVTCTKIVFVCLFYNFLIDKNFRRRRNVVIVTPTQPNYSYNPCPKIKGGHTKKTWMTIIIVSLFIITLTTKLSWVWIVNIRWFRNIGINKLIQEDIYILQHSNLKMIMNYLGMKYIAKLNRN